MVGIRSDDAIIEGIFTERLHALRIAEAGGNDVITVLGNVFIREDELGNLASVVKVSASLFYRWQVLIDNKSSAIGECTLEYPVYSSGEDCTEASIIGYYYVRVFRARITAVPGFDASYKQAQTYQFTLTALDASHLRNDEYCYACAYKEGNKKDW